MGLELAGLVLSVVASAVAATWAIITKMTKIEVALTQHVATEEIRYDRLDHRVMVLETAPNRRK